MNAQEAWSLPSSDEHPRAMREYNEARGTINNIMFIQGLPFWGSHMYIDNNNHNNNIILSILFISIYGANAAQFVLYIPTYMSRQTLGTYC